MELMGKYFNLPCLNVVHGGASFFFLVDIRLGKGGEDVREVAAEPPPRLPSTGTWNQNRAGKVVGGGNALRLEVHVKEGIDRVGHHQVH